MQLTESVGMGKMSLKITTWLQLTCFFEVLMAVTADAQLSMAFYASSCPGAEAKVAQVVTSWIRFDRTLAPALLRLHYHDCFVRGCDASVLLDSVSGSPAEKDSPMNKNSLRGLQVINDIKTRIEAVCPNIVSCSDILALAARDAIVAFGGTYWNVPLGRRDGMTSFAYEASSELPPPTATFDSLVSAFGRKGLSMKDMIVLSGAHTVGSAHCSNFQSRLYNFNSTVQTDPNLDPFFAASLKLRCGFGDTTTMVKMDQNRWVDSWDTNYYSNVLRGKVLFQSDDSLKNPQGFKLVNELNRFGSLFNTEFASSMENLGKIGVLTGTSGQIRRKCNLVN